MRGLFQRRAITALTLSIIPITTPVLAEMLTVPAQPLALALEALAAQSNTQVLYAAELVDGLTAKPVQGDLSAQEALTRMLSGSGLVARQTGASSFTIVTAAAARLKTVTVTAHTEDDKGYKTDTATIGGKTAPPLREVANSVSVMTRERLDDQNFVDVDHAMAWATGVDTRPNDGVQSQYYSRGYAMSAMYDGMPAYNSLSGYQQLDLAMYERLEILRGPSGLMQGSAEPGGSVNMVRKRPTDGVQASATASVGSWNTYRGTADVSTPLTKDERLKGRFVVAATDRDYFYDDAHTTKWLGYGIVEFAPNPDWLLSYSLAYQHDDSVPFYGLPVYSDLQPVDFDRSANPMTPWSAMRWETQEHKLELEHKFANGWEAKAAGTWRDQTLDWKDGYPGSVNRTNNTATYTLRDQSYQYYRKAADAYVNGPFTLFGREHNLLLGTNIDIFNYDGDYGVNQTVSGVSIFNPSGIAEPNLAHTSGTEVRTTQYGQYGQLRMRAFDPLLLIAGGRNTSFDSKNRSMTSSQWANWKQGAKAMNEFTPYGGAVLDVTDEKSIYASYSDIFVPQTSMMSSGSVVPPRVGWQAEVGIKHESIDKKLGWTIAAFVIRDTNRAITDPANSTYSVPAGLVESKGYEAEVTGAPVEGLKLAAGYTYLTTQYVDAGTSSGTTFSTWEPRHSLKAWGIYSFNDGPMEGWSLGAGMIAKSQTYGTSHQIHQNAYAVFDAQIGYKINDNLSMTLTGNNLFDNEYWAKILSTTNNFYGEPQSFTLALKAKM